MELMNTATRRRGDLTDPSLLEYAQLGAIRRVTSPDATPTSWKSEPWKQCDAA